MSEVKIKRREAYAANQSAFEEVFGNPFAKPDAIPGHYNTLLGRGLIAAMKNDFDEGKATRNPAAPNVVDFICDVQSAISCTLSRTEIEKFVAVYMHETDGDLNSKKRTDFEQRLGQVLRDRKLSPVARYFKTVRQPSVRRRK